MTFTQQLIIFFTKHWILCSGFIAALALLIFQEAKEKGLGMQLSVQAAISKMNNEDARLIDVRTPELFRAVHIKGAKNIPKDQIEKKIESLLKQAKKPVIVVCAKGQTAGPVAIQLKKSGLEQAFVLSGGMDAWKHAGMPVITK